MRALAEFVMKSRSRAMGAAAIAAVIPVLSLVSCAIVALVWLRMGRNEGLKVLLAAALPALYYWLGLNSPGVILTLAGVVILAECLRSEQGWARTLMLATLLAALVALNLQWLPDEVLQRVVRLLLDEGGLAQQYNLGVTEQERIQQLLSSLLNGVITTVELVSLLTGLILARWWQALLYNPGGFQREFHALRLPPWACLPLLLVMLMLMSGQSWLLPVLPVLLVPYILAALALIHGIFGIKSYNSFWLGLLYVLLLFALPYMSVLLVLIALADSLMNFRHRLVPTSSRKDDDES